MRLATRKQLSAYGCLQSGQTLRIVPWPGHEPVSGISRPITCGWELVTSAGARHLVTPAALQFTE